MANPAASPPANIDFTCTTEELFISFDKLTSGSPLPSNVIDENPYRYKPQNLPDDCWFFISLKENIDMEHGFWKTKEEACEVFSNPDIIGWRTTLEYYEGQVPYECKTNWVMQVFSTTQKRPCDDSEKKESSSLCRVFLIPSHEMQQKVLSASVDNETRNHLTQAPLLDANSSAGIGPSSSPEVNKHDETDVLAVAETLPVPEHHGDNLVDMDIFSRGHIGYYSGGDFLELEDLDTPASPSSISENSSAVSISSGECFDSMAFLHELEDQVLEQNDAGRKLIVSASNKSDEVVIAPATLGSSASVEGSNSDSNESFKIGEKIIKHDKGDQKGGEGPSSSSRKPSTSSDSNTAAAAGGRKRAGFGGMRKLGKKYLCILCFMPL